MNRISAILTPKPSFRLVGLNGQDKGCKYTLQDDLTNGTKLISIGSDKDCNISLGNLRIFIDPEEQHHVASVHGAFLIEENKGVEYIDFGSKDFLGEGYTSKVNGTTLEKNIKHKLTNGDRITIGDYEFRFKRKYKILQALQKLAASLLFA